MFLKSLILLILHAHANCQSERPSEYTPPYRNESENENSRSRTLEGRSSLRGGRQASVGEVPYHVIIQYEGSFRCSGAFVIGAKGQHVIATTASCLMYPKQSLTMPGPVFWVIAGRRYKNEPYGSEQKRQGKRVRFHRGVHRSSHENDFAVLFLSEPFKITATVQPIGLPMKDWPTPKYYSVSGWGEHGELMVTDQLVAVDNWDCYVHYNWIYYKYAVFESTLCLEDKDRQGRGNCPGDDGSPAVGTSRGEPFLAGIFQWKHPPCGNDFPGIYANMDTFAEWIDVVTLEKDSTPDSVGRRR